MDPHSINICFCDNDGYDFCPHCLGSGVSINHGNDDYISLKPVKSDITNLTAQISTKGKIEIQIKKDLEYITWVRNNFIKLDSYQAVNVILRFRRCICSWEKIIMKLNVLSDKSLAVEHLKAIKPQVKGIEKHLLIGKITTEKRSFVEEKINSKAKRFK